MNIETFNFTYRDVELTLNKRHYICYLTATLRLEDGQETHWHKMPVSEYYLDRISDYTFQSVIGAIEDVYNTLKTLPEGTMMVEECTIKGIKYNKGAADICKQFKPGMALTIKPEPNNPVDHDALMVLRLGKKIGYVDKSILRNIKISHAKKISARVIRQSKEYGEESVQIAIVGKVDDDSITWKGVDKESDEVKEAKKELNEFINFKRIYKALRNWHICGRPIKASWYTVIPLSGELLATKPYAGEYKKPTFECNDAFRLAELPSEAQGFAVFTGRCLTYICLCANNREVAKRLRCVPSFSGHPGTLKLTKEVAEVIIMQYLDGIAKFGIESDYCYFGHQSGVIEGECFLGPDGGMDFTYIKCNSRRGFISHGVNIY